MLLSKGFEVEVYTGTPTGDVIGFSDRIVANLNGFVREPDNRNVEYTTAPYRQYERLLVALIAPRQRLRQYLRSLGDYTIMPGSTLALGGTDKVQRSDPQNPYHSYIEQTYGTDVVTASVHINLGIPDLAELFRACRILRLEAPLYLALSASSPFLNGQVTGSHSSRWQMFPKTPAQVPIFTDHQHYIDWTEAQLRSGAMQNVRHLWSSVRPNGDNRPHDLNRAELRICDLIFDPLAMLAITTFIELRLLAIGIHNHLAQSTGMPFNLPVELTDNLELGLDPLVAGTTPFSLSELEAIADANEIAAAKDSLDAVLTHWQTGEQILARDWIKQQYDQTRAIAKHLGLACFVSPLLKILECGNEAQCWLAAYNSGLSPRQILTTAISSAAEQENKLAIDLADVLELA
ncbi:glutamate/cysteine ligase [Thalassoporum mexicanum PCC 7367]|uniref:glutamate--cysteine ligase n=1 Tax=Thalassoporum mexicanum TaxID=3457544 RepID=UPI00029FC2F2|nr:glutamate--cysteine ligase [Pseudanabaena sp. PCC 7367]AFY68333.1 glutamate/cysteine ligase [Pseudanabaena sp. PCC 7367]